MDIDEPRRECKFLLADYEKNERRCLHASMGRTRRERNPAQCPANETVSIRFNQSFYPTALSPLGALNPARK